MKQKRREIKVLRHTKGNAIGGKAAGLITLADCKRDGIFEDIIAKMGRESRFRTAERLKVDIPNTCVLGEGHYRSHMEHPDVKDALLHDRLEEIPEIIRRIGVGDQRTKRMLRRFLGKNPGPVIFRSSASCEDSSSAPFAGDFTSVFFYNNPIYPIRERIQHAEQAMLEVYASMFSGEIIAKMRSYGMVLEDHFMAVAMQRVVGDIRKININGKTRELYFPFMSGVLASRCSGMQRPDNVLRDQPFARIGFGMGTVVVSAKEEQPIPCALIFPSLGALTGMAISGSVQEGRYDPSYEITDVWMRSQHCFDALDMQTGKLIRVNFSDVDDFFFFCKVKDAFTFFSKEDMKHGMLSFTDKATARATFYSFFNNTAEGKIIMGFLLKLSEKLRELCGFDVDVEFSATTKDRDINLELLQLRPFGIPNQEPVALSQVSEQNLIARTSDCIGHGRYKLDRIVIVTEDAVEDIGRAQHAIAAINNKHTGKFLIIGPNIKEQVGIGGVYSGLHKPGAVVSYCTDTSMTTPGTHVFMNSSAMPIINCGQDEINRKIRKLLQNDKIEKMANGVYIIETRVIAELDDITGKGQVFLGE